MMDIFMILILLISFGVLKLFVRFCQSEIEPKQKA